MGSANKRMDSGSFFPMHNNAKKNIIIIGLIVSLNRKESSKNINLDNILDNVTEIT